MWLIHPNGHIEAVKPLGKTMIGSLYVQARQAEGCIFVYSDEEASFKADLESGVAMAAGVGLSVSPVPIELANLTPIQRNLLSQFQKLAPHLHVCMEPLHRR